MTLQIIFQLGAFATNILLPVSVALVLVGTALEHKRVLKYAFITGVATAILYLAVFVAQLVQISMSGQVNLSEILTTKEALADIALSVLIPVLVALGAAFVAHKAYKK
jgi:hypothetical protein